MAEHVGLLLVAHRYDHESTAELRALMSAAAAGPARLATVGHADFDDVREGARTLRERGCDGIAVVPLLILSDSSLTRRVRDMAPALAGELGVPVATTAALDAAPEVAAVLGDRARDLAAGAESRHAVMLIGHGPSLSDDLPPWEAAGMTLAEAVREAGGFARARAAVVQDDAEPAVRAAAVRSVRDRIARFAGDTGQPVIVVPWLVGAGHLTRTQLPEDVAGLDIRYDGRPLLPHPQLGRWVRREFAAAAAALSGAPPGAAIDVRER